MKNLRTFPEAANSENTKTAAVPQQLEIKNSEQLLSISRHDGGNARFRTIRNTQPASIAFRFVYFNDFSFRPFIIKAFFYFAFGKMASGKHMILECLSKKKDNFYHSQLFLTCNFPEMN